ncbi:MAG: hypothetical protein J6X30_00125 [Clostridia bacterium]|nr:hypothetical protein [Clostridia bacterium]
MKKVLGLLLVLCLAVSCLSMAVMAEEENNDAVLTIGAETKKVESLVGMYYLQGESGYGYVAGGNEWSSDYDYSIADELAKIVDGTNRVPFYAYTKDGKVFFDRFAQQAFITEINYAAAAGVDFIAYRYYDGGNNTTPLVFMNNQLSLHATLATQEEGFDKKVDFALVLTGDYEAGKEANLIITNYLTVKGYLTASDGRPVVFIEWNDGIADQIDKTNTKLKKAVADGLNDKKKTAPKTQLNDDVEKMYVVALNAPSYDAAISAGADAISWTEGSGKSGEAYTNMTAKVEAAWANGATVVPNVVTGFDKTGLAANPISVSGKKYTSDKTNSVRYERSAAADDSVAAATPAELIDHLKKAVETTNKPTEFPAVMVYAWDDFAGGAYLCPTKAEKAYQFEFSYLKAIREYLMGTATGFGAIETDEYREEDGKAITTKILTKEDNSYTITVTEKAPGQDPVVTVTEYDASGNKISNGSTTEGTPVPGDQTPASTDEGNSSLGGNTTLFIIIGAVVAVVVIAVVVILLTKKKKPADK